ncbi:hypothetical protein SEVIR_5G270832v4 [Setaria viridis]
MDSAGMHHRRLPLSYMAMSAINHFGTSHHHGGRSSLVASLNHIRHRNHASTSTMVPATMGICSNSLLPTQLPMAHTQSMATINSSCSRFLLFTICLPVGLGSSHLQCSIS